MELIDKIKLLEGLEKLKQNLSASPIVVMEDVESLVESLEVKEDLENLFQALPEYIADKKSHQIYRLSIYHYDGECVVDYVGEIDHDSLYSFGGNTLYEAIEKAWNWLRENSTGG